MDISNREKKKKIFVLAIAALLSIIGILYLLYPLHRYTTGEDDQFTIKVGESFSIKLYENGTTGYQNCWLNESKCKCIKLTTRQYENSFNQSLGYIGSGGIIEFAFIGTQIGLDTLKFTNCPTAVEHKRCADFSNDSTKSDNEFIVAVTK